MKVAMIAPPWLPVPPHGYGGIEAVVHALCEQLVLLGVDVELFTIGDASTLARCPVPARSLFERPHYERIAGTLYDTVTLPTAHVMFALDQVAARGDFDVIHDHNAFVGLAACAHLDPDRFPPSLHTLHGPFTSAQDIGAGAPDNRSAYRTLARAERLWVNGISAAQLRGAPPELDPRIAGVVHNGVDLAALVPGDPAERGDYFLTLARVCPDKNQGLAARLCAERGRRLVVAGAVHGIGDPAELQRVLTADAGDADPRSDHRDVRYFADEIAPHLAPGRIEYLGDVGGARKLELVQRAAALLFPIDWEEPFGMAVIEALACGTPVVAMRRGALPEIVEHGVNGFLADTPEQFAAYMGRVGEIDPADCRRSVEARFSARAMAEGYLRAYRRIAAEAGARTPMDTRTALAPAGVRVSVGADVHVPLLDGDPPLAVEGVHADDLQALEPVGRV